SPPGPSRSRPSPWAISARAAIPPPGSTACWSGAPMARRLALVCWLLATLGAHADQWLPVREIGLELAPGSPLDFSTLLPNPPLDADHRLVVANGRLAMSDRPEQPVPLLCASLGWSPAS